MVDEPAIRHREGPKADATIRKTRGSPPFLWIATAAFAASP
jgi:hypothetical protein